MYVTKKNLMHFHVRSCDIITGEHHQHHTEEAYQVLQATLARSSSNKHMCSQRTFRYSDSQKSSVIYLDWFSGSWSHHMFLCQCSFWQADHRPVRADFLSFVWFHSCCCLENFYALPCWLWKKNNVIAKYWTKQLVNTMQVWEIVLMSEVKSNTISLFYFTVLSSVVAFLLSRRIFISVQRIYFFLHPTGLHSHSETPKRVTFSPQTHTHTPSVWAALFIWYYLMIIWKL